MNYVNTIVKAAILIYIVLFAVSNAGETTVVLFPKYLAPKIPLFVPILGALFVGGIVVALGFATEHMRFKKELKNTRRNLTRTEEELQRLRTRPLLQDSDNLKKDS